jgi:hypothetical protein
MADTTESTKGERDAVARLVQRGEQTMARLADLPGSSRVLSAINDLRDRVDDLGRRVRGIEELERRVAALEGEVAALRADASE